MNTEQGAFQKLTDEEQGFIMEIQSGYHHRTGLRHPDCSMGIIKISPKEFNDCLAHALRRGF